MDQISKDTPKLTDGQTYEVFFPLYRPGSIAGAKFSDENMDKVKDPGEVPMANVTFSIGGGKTQVTDANGAFLFSDLEPGDYSVEEQTPAGYVSTTGAVQDVSVESGQDVENILFGNVKSGTIQGFKFEDLNSDGKHDVGVEKGVPGVTFWLVAAAFSAPTLTDNNGQFMFSDIFPGTYAVWEEVPEGSFATTPTSKTLVVLPGVVVEMEFGNAPMQMDFGDARESGNLQDPLPFGYPVTLANNGARHFISGSIRLGPNIDSESDGQPSDNADGDDTTLQPDEDGIEFKTSLVRGRIARLTPLNTVSGYLNAWIDYNRDGDWEDDGEHAIADENIQTAPGRPVKGLLAFTVPGNAQPGLTFARFRFSTFAGLGFTGPAANGEVEDYLVEIFSTAYDFGDAPDPLYPSLLARDGARHVIADGYILGNFVDAEGDAYQGQGAAGDDLNPTHLEDDEDGVAFTSSLSPGRTASIDVYVTYDATQGTTPTQPAYLDAWVDFNDDDDWDDAGEQVFASEPLQLDRNSLTFDVPASATLTDETYARFRLSGKGGLSPTGPADDGEVEDYQVRIIQIVARSGNAWVLY